MSTASLLSLPYELRERILIPNLRRHGTIELQYPIWADSGKTVFTQPIMQVCRQLREEAIPLFYRQNVWVWVLDPEEDNRPDPTAYPIGLEIGPGVDRTRGPCGTLISTLPWYYPGALSNIRHLRLNMYLPTSHDRPAWTTGFPTKLARFVQSLDYGSTLRSLKILVGTWYTLLNFSTSQAAVFDVLEQMQIRGTVEIRTKNIYNETKAAVRSLDLEHRMLANQPFSDRHGRDGQSARPYLDWEWEGGKALPQNADALLRTSSDEEGIAA
nr:hypothetical protein B0A51_11883 [Rachicladosporium sp. CCFEE 5018]